MRTIIAWVGGALLVLVAITLEGMLLPHLQPILTPVVPAIGELIQSTMTRTNEALFTTAIRYTAAGYREPGDVLLTFIALLVIVGMAVGGVVALHRLPRPIASGWKKHVGSALVILVALGFGYLMWALATELSARTTAMQMYKLYQRKMAALAPYISPQDGAELVSQWARMGTRADLRAMDERFRVLLRQHGLTSDGPPAANLQ